MHFVTAPLRFAKDEAGAITVDWVIMTAAVVGLGVAVLSSVTPGAKTAASSIPTKMDAATVTTTFP